MARAKPPLPTRARRAAAELPSRPAPSSNGHARTFGFEEDGPLRQIALLDIHPNPAQPRKSFDEDRLAELAGSIAERGVLQPPIVRPRAAGGYELIAGERRWRAAQLAGLEQIPALVRDAGDEITLELALIENVAREDLNVVEEARAVAALQDDLAVDKTTLARRLGRSRSDLSHLVRLLELPDQVLDFIATGDLSKGHGKVLLGVEDHKLRRDLAASAVQHGWSVRKLEAEVAAAAAPDMPAAGPPADQLEAASRLEDELRAAVGRDVRARPHRDGFRLTIDLADLADSQALLKQLKA